MEGFLRISCKTCETSIILSMRSTRSDCMEQSKRTLRCCCRWEPLCCHHWLTRRLAISLELRWWPLFRSVFQTPQSTGKITVAYRFEPRTHFQTSSEELIHEVLNKNVAMTVSSHTGSNKRHCTKGHPIRERGTLHMCSHDRTCNHEPCTHIDAYVTSLSAFDKLLTVVFLLW